MLERLPSGARPQVQSGLTSRSLSFGDKFRAHDGDLARGIDPQPHLPSLESHDCDADVIADEKLLHELSGQHEHKWLPFQNPDASLPTQVELSCHVRLPRDG
jgi:hypothetical protein